MVLENVYALVRQGYHKWKMAANWTMQLSEDYPEDLTQEALRNHLSYLSGIQPDCQVDHFLKLYR